MVSLPQLVKMQSFRPLSQLIAHIVWLLQHVLSNGAHQLGNSRNNSISLLGQCPRLIRVQFKSIKTIVLATNPHM